MIIPKHLNWWNHMFKEREEKGNTENSISCAMYGTVCTEQCKSCTWLKEISRADEQIKVTCQPPVIWE